MDLNTTLTAVSNGAQWINGLALGVDNIGGILQVFLILLGALDIVATFLLPQAAVVRIPKIIRIVSAVMKAFKYMAQEFDKLEKTKGGFTMQQEDTKQPKKP